MACSRERSGGLLGRTAAVGAVARSRPGVTLQHAGGGSVGSAITRIVTHDLRHSQIVTLPVTLVILALAFGALVAASVPLLLGLTSVAVALGAVGRPIVMWLPLFAFVVLFGLSMDYTVLMLERMRARKLPRRSLSCATWRVGSRRRCSPTAGS
jgi:uncharacterized membrane protein YdfJ with MMPL/SSD domain